MTTDWNIKSFLGHKRTDVCHFSFQSVFNCFTCIYLEPFCSNLTYEMHLYYMDKLLSK